MNQHKAKTLVLGAALLLAGCALEDHSLEGGGEDLNARMEALEQSVRLQEAKLSTQMDVIRAGDEFLWARSDKAVYELRLAVCLLRTGHLDGDPEFGYPVHTTDVAISYLPEVCQDLALDVRRERERVQKAVAERRRVDQAQDGA